MGKRKSAVKKPVKPAGVVKKEAVAVKAAPIAAKPNNSKLIMVISAVVALVIIGEIYFALKNQVTMSKKPVLAAEWRPEYRGQIGMPVSGNHMYILDNNANQVKKYEKLTGKIASIYQFTSTPRLAVETSTGDSLIILSGTGMILRYAGDKQTAKITLPDVKDAVGMVIDKADNVYVSDAPTGKIFKYSLDGTKILEFGGKGSDSSKFTGISKLFIDVKDNIYAFDASAVLKTKVFDSNGKFQREFTLPLKKTGGLESIAVTPDNNIYLNDMVENQILVLNQKGKIIGKFNMDSASRYKIGSPGALSGGPDGYIYVGSYSNAVFEPIKY